MKIIAGSIDLNKIDKSRIVTTDKEGKPFANGAKWYPISIIVNDEKDKYGNDTSIATGLTKEEREAKVKAVFLGNAKTVWESAVKENKSQAPNGQNPDTSSVPF